MWQKKYVWIHSTHKRVHNKYHTTSGKILTCVYDGHFTIQSQERICEWQWSDTTDTGKSSDSDNMPNVLYPDYINTT